MAVLGISLVWNPFAATPHRDTSAARVHIQKEQEGYRIIRNGNPYDIKGAAVTDTSMLRRVKENGGNSVRVYDVQNAQAWLDAAAHYGLSVILALPIKQQGNGIDYGNDAAVQAQRALVRNTILRYRHHPALLMWVVGNEPTIFVEPEYSNFFLLRKVLKAVDEIAVLVHQLDQDHPAVLVHAGFFPKLLKLTGIFCPNIDLICFNSFSAVAGFIKKLESAGWDKPFFFAEFGSRGYWSWKETDWLSRLEPTSFEKARYLQSQFQSLAQATRNKKCLGGYVFLWGIKNEYTPTAFSLFAPGREPAATELVDVCRKAWLGAGSECAAPSIAYLNLDGKKDEENVYLLPGATARVGLAWVGRPSGTLRVRWELHEERGEYLLSSYKDQKQELIRSDSFAIMHESSPIVATSNQSSGEQLFDLQVPTKPGPYRLYVYVANDCQKVATANACFFVQPD
ncbi:hypothetical protein BUE76_06450 [Cnuella takakiae]|nr:hypothetical protein BUE76_06450 [Cnuella takakiae]